MTTFKKITSLIITLSLVLTLGINVFALGGGTVETLTATASDRTVTVSGTTQNVAASVSVQVLDSNNKVIGMNSFVVSNNEFSGTVSISVKAGFDTELTIRAADSDGGDWKTISSQPLAVFKGYCVRLDGRVGVDYYVELSDSLKNDNTKMTFTHDSCVNGLRTQEISLSDATIVNGLYVFKCSIVPSDMTLPVTATLTNGDTEIVFEQFSAREYVSAYTADTGKLGNLAKSIRNYGYYAQCKFGPMQPIYEEDKVTLTEPNFDIVTVDSIGEGISYYGSSVVFTSGNRIKHYFEISGDADQFTFTIDGKSVEKVAAGQSGAGVALYSISSEEMPVGLLNKALEVKIFYNGEEIKSFSYSAMNYAKKAASSANNEEMKNLGKAFAMYYDAAIAYNTQG